MRARRLIFSACSLLYFSVVLYIVVNAIAHPYYNWDIFGYVGSVLSWSAKDDNTLYVRVLTVMKNGIPRWVYGQHVASSLIMDAKAFGQQLPIYQVKPLYNALIWLLFKCGWQLPMASWVVSALSFGCMGLLLWCWKPSYMAREFWQMLVVALCFLYPLSMASLAAFSTPDALCTFLTMAAFYCLCSGRGIFWFTVVALLAQLARPDAIIISGALASYFALFAPSEWKVRKLDAVLCMLFLFTVYVLVTRLAGGYSLEKFFLYSFMGKMTYPADDKRQLDWIDYLYVIRFSAPLFLMMPRTLTMLLWSGIACLLYVIKPQEGCKADIRLLLLCWAALGFRFLLYPAYSDDRYYFSYFLIMLYCGGEVIAAYAMLAFKRDANAKNA